MTEWHKAALQAEIAALEAAGLEQVTPAEFRARYDAAGFRFDSDCTIKQFSRYMTGPRAGESVPNITLYPVHKTLGISGFHVDLPETERAKLRVLRNNIFAVSRGYILEV